MLSIRTEALGPPQEDQLKATLPHQITHLISYIIRQHLRASRLFLLFP